MTSRIAVALAVVAVTLSVTFAFAQFPPLPGTPPAGSPTAPPAQETVTTVAAPEAVEITQVVAPASAATNAFVPPAGAILVVTDVIITNPNASPTCAVGLQRGDTPVTGALCIPARTSLSLALTTGIDFREGEPVTLVNSATDAAGPVSFHIRGVLTPAV